MTTTIRLLLIATALLTTAATAAVGQETLGQQTLGQQALGQQTLGQDALRADVIATPVLRASVTVSGDVVRIGDILDNAGPVAQIAIYRAPDLGTVGTLSTAQVVAALRAHQVIGVDTRDLKSITVTRLSRSIESKDIENHVAQALEHRNGLGDAANLNLTFDRDVQSLQLDASNTGALQAVSTRFDSRSGRFDVTFVINNDANASVTKLRFTGTAVEMADAAVLARAVERNEVLKASDVVTERRPKAEVGTDGASRERAVGMQSRRQLRAGQAIKNADLAKPDLVVRDQAVMLIYESAGLYLTIRGKAVEGGTEGDVVNVMNLQSKRTVAGVVIGRGQVAVSAPSPRLQAPLQAPVAAPSPAPAPVSESIAPARISQTISQARPSAAAPVAMAANDRVPVSRKAE